MWPLLLLLLLAGGSGSKAQLPGAQPGGGGGGGGGGPPGQCPYSGPLLGFTVPLASDVPDLTTAEYASMFTIMAAFNKRLSGTPYYAPWKVCNGNDVATIATVPLDELGALAMMVYWGATKSKASRPWPTEDLEVLAKAPVVNPFAPDLGKVPAAEYFVWRIKVYKQVLNQYLSANLNA